MKVLVLGMLCAAALPGFVPPLSASPAREPVSLAAAVKPWKPPAPTPAATPAIRPEPEWLPDTAVLLKVDDRVVRVRDYVTTWFATYPEERPGSDSLGRAQFLETLSTKAILGLIAARTGRRLTPADEQRLAQETDVLLSQALYRHIVLDSIFVTD